MRDEVVICALTHNDPSARAVCSTGLICRHRLSLIELMYTLPAVKSERLYDCFELTPLGH